MHTWKTIKEFSLIVGVHPDNANEVYEYEPMHEEYDYVTAEHHFDAPMDPFTKVMNDHSDDIEHAFESVYFSVDGFGANAEAFMTALAPIAEHFNEKYVKGGVHLILQSITPSVVSFTVIVITINFNVTGNIIVNIDLVGRENYRSLI